MCVHSYRWWESGVSLSYCNAHIKIWTNPHSTLLQIYWDMTDSTLVVSKSFYIFIPSCKISILYAKLYEFCQSTVRDLWAQWEDNVIHFCCFGLVLTPPLNWSFSLRLFQWIVNCAQGGDLVMTNCNPPMLVGETWKEVRDEVNPKPFFRVSAQCCVSLTHASYWTYTDMAVGEMLVFYG